MQLLEGNGWLQSKAWKAAGPDGRNLSFFGVYLICDGRYHRCPCLISPVKAGVPGSAVMKWSSKVESMRKDVKGVFGILKARFKFLKNLNSLKHHASSIDNAFVTCSILHNMLLESDGWKVGSKKFGNIYGNTWNDTAGIWIRVEDDTIDEGNGGRKPASPAISCQQKDACATG
jgi:hypothetical protein